MGLGLAKLLGPKVCVRRMHEGPIRLTKAWDSMESSIPRDNNNNAHMSQKGS
jgi:hypothetical protein